MGNLMKNGVSYTGSMLGGSTKTFKGILEAGETSISFVDTLITGNSTIDYETSKLGVNPIDIEVANNAVTLTFAAQAEDIGIKVTISNDAAEPAPTKMRFLKATGAQKITLPVEATTDTIVDCYVLANRENNNEEVLIANEFNWNYDLHSYGTASENSITYRWLYRNTERTVTVPKNKVAHLILSQDKLQVNEQSASTTATGPIGSGNLKVFGLAGHYSRFSISRMKIYKLGNLVMDLLPTKIGGEACYYDLVGKKAYFSETSTPFELEEIDYTPTNPNDPRFVETVIATNPNVQDIDISFTDSWNNYDLLKIELASYADPTAQSVYFYTTPKHINTIASLGGVLRIYVADHSRTYSINTSTLTWTTFASGGNWCVKEVKGLKCNNCVFTEDQIFIGTTAGDNQQVEIISQNSLFTYDLIFVTINDGNYTRCTPSENMIIPIKNNMFNPFVSYYLSSSNYPATVKVSENKLSAARYMYVTGVRFT